MKSKFKVMDILRLIDKQHNMTKGGLYCANQVFELDSDIPIIETVDDYGLVVSLYETSFEATDVVLATNKTIMSEEEAVFTVEAKIDECYKEENVVGGKGDLFVNYFVGSEFITKIQHDKELQKALLVLIGEIMSADIKTNNVWLMKGDCLERMKEIESGSVDLILTDPPYGTTACKWDSVIPLDKMWEQLKRIIKPNGAVVLFGSQPFTSVLITSNLKMFKYEWIWEKAVGSNFAVLKYQPMKEHENILVFAGGKHNYYPIKEPRKGSGAKRMDYGHNGSVTGEANGTQIFVGWDVGKYDKDLRSPSSVQFFNNREKCRGLHPTQKPVALMEYLIKTYTNESETVLDFTFGSGTTGVACVNTNRKFIGIEMDDHYFDIGSKRIASAGVGYDKTI